jgi:hypothetical protein
MGFLDRIFRQVNGSQIAGERELGADGSGGR